jgi:hypothetical protein
MPPTTPDPTRSNNSSWSEKKLEKQSEKELGRRRAHQSRGYKLSVESGLSVEIVSAGNRSLIFPAVNLRLSFTPSPPGASAACWRERLPA